MSQRLRVLRYWMCSCLITTLCASAVGQTFPRPATPAKGIKPSIATENCTTGECHAALLTRKVVHGPVAAKQCLDCHKYADATQHRFQRLTQSNQGCIRCHDMKHKSVVHAPVQHGSCT